MTAILSCTSVDACVPSTSFLICHPRFPLQCARTRFNNMKYVHTAFVLAIAAYLMFTVGCGGNSSSSNQTSTFGSGSVSSTPTPTPTPTPSSTPATGPNTMTINVNSGPGGNYANGIFASVTVCIHGTSTCQTIPNILVDTG